MTEQACQTRDLKYYFDSFSTHYGLSLGVQEKCLEVLAMGAGNPSSVHQEGRFAKKILRKQRDTLAALFNTDEDAIIFTSGVTESVNLAIVGYLGMLNKKNKTHLYTTPFEHAAHQNTLKSIANSNPYLLATLPFYQNATLDQAQAHALLIKNPAAAIIIQAVNQDLGFRLPMQELCELAKTYETPILLDAAQAQSWVFDLWQNESIKTMAVSSHKIGGPTGVGLLLKRPYTKLQPMIRGGVQEQELRAGTEALALIAGMTQAFVEQAQTRLEHTNVLNSLTNYFNTQIKHACPDIILFTPRFELCQPGVSALALPGKTGQAVVQALANLGFSVSSGAACAAMSQKNNIGMAVLGISKERAIEMVRVSFDIRQHTQDIDALIRAFAQINQSIAS